MTEDIKEEIRQAQSMQLATTVQEKPWIATVYFVADTNMNLYWLSYPNRRHSQEMAENPNVAVAIVMKADQPVMGLQAVGTVEPVNDPELIQKIMPSYIQKYGQGSEFYERFIAGTAKHAMYKFMPTTFVLFDELHSPGDARKELTL